MYCKYCGEKINSDNNEHECPKKGLLNINEDDSFLVSALIGYATDSFIIGGALGGDLVGGILGDILNND